MWGSEEKIVNSTVTLYEGVSEIRNIKSRGDTIIYMKQSGELYQYSIKSQKSVFVDSLEKLKDISLGSGYMGIIHHDNTLHMAGSNKYGQLGTGNRVSKDKGFEQIETLEPTRVTKVS